MVSDLFIESEERLSTAVESLKQAIDGMKDAPKRVTVLTAEKQVLEDGFQKLKDDFETLEAAFLTLKKKYEQLVDQPSGQSEEDLLKFKAELKTRVDKTIACLEQALN